VERIRIAFVALPPMLESIVRDVVAAQSDMEVVDSPGRADASAAAEIDADVVVVGRGAGGDEALVELLDARARQRVLAISSDGRSGALFELVPTERALGDISPASLVSAIRRSAWTQTRGDAVRRR
jgi:DNA-binding NarL/FixJ family response regulator